MKIVKKVVNDHLYSNTLWLILNSMLLTGFGFIFWTINARLFTPEQVGLGTTIISSMELIAGLALLGFNVALVRYLPRAAKKDKIISSCFSLSAVVALVLSIVFILGLGIFSPKLLFLKEISLYAILFVIFVVFYVSIFAPNLLEDKTIPLFSALGFNILLMALYKPAFPYLDRISHTDTSTVDWSAIAIAFGAAFAIISVDLIFFY